MRPLIVALLFVACARPPPRPAPIAPSAPAATPTVSRAGKLVVRHYVHGLVVCGNACAPVTDAKIASAVQAGPGRYFLSTATETLAYDAKTQIITPIEGPGVISELEDGSLLRFEHLSLRSRVFRKRPGEGWTALLAYEKYRAQELRFLPGGRHLFKDSPGMGGSESPYFVDLVVGRPTHLYVVDAVGDEPRKVHSSSQQMDADFIDGGRRIVWWQPGKIDTHRALTLEVLDIATKNVSVVDRVVTPLVLPSGSVRRDAPDMSTSPRSTWVVHAKTYSADFRVTSLRAVDVATGEHVDRELAADETLMHGVPHHSIYNRQQARRWSEHIVIARRGEQSTTLSVLTIPSLEVVYTMDVPSQGLTGADWVETP